MISDVLRCISAMSERFGLGMRDAGIAGVVSSAVSARYMCDEDPLVCD